MKGTRIVVRAIARGGELTLEADNYSFGPDETGIMEWKYTERNDFSLTPFVKWDKDPAQKARAIDIARVEIIGLEYDGHRLVFSSAQGHP